MGIINHMWINTLSKISNESLFNNHLYEHCVLRATTEAILKNHSGASFSLFGNSYDRGLILVDITAANEMILKTLENLIKELSTNNLIRQLPTALKEIELEHGVAVASVADDFWQAIERIHNDNQWHTPETQTTSDLIKSQTTYEPPKHSQHEYPGYTLKLELTDLTPAQTVLYATMSTFVANEVYNRLVARNTVYVSEFIYYDRSKSGKKLTTRFKFLSDDKPEELLKTATDAVNSLVDRSDIIHGYITQQLADGWLEENNHDVYESTALIINNGELLKFATAKNLKQLLGSIKLVIK